MLEIIDSNKLKYGSQRKRGLPHNLSHLVRTCDCIRRADGHDNGADREVRDGQAHQEHVRDLKNEGSHLYSCILENKLRSR